MFLLPRMNFTNFIIIYIYIIFLLIKLLFGNVFIDIKKLSLSDSYLVVLDTGLYLYNFKNFDCSIILNFNSSVYRNTTNKVILNELNDENNLYILCLVNEYLFIFNENNNKTISYQINDFNLSPDKYYDLLPYKFQQNNISFIISYLNEPIIMTFYYYNFTLKNDIIAHIEISFDNFEINNNNKISCQINSYLSTIKCFFHDIIDNKKYISTASFLIQDMNIIFDGISHFETDNSANINQLKTAKSVNNKFFICFSENAHPVCCINDYSTNEISEINCKFGYGYGPNYKVLYFNETNQFMLISQNSLDTTLYNSINNEVEKCQEYILTPQSFAYNIIYDNNIQDYNYVNYRNCSNHMKCYNISISEDEQTIIPSLPTENNNLIYTTHINCYYTCNPCEEEGNDLNHNCLECNIHFPFSIEKNNYLNCYQNFINSTENITEEEEIIFYNEILKNIESSFTSQYYNTSNIDAGIDEIVLTEKMKITLTTTQNQKKNLNDYCNRFRTM